MSKNPWYWETQVMILSAIVVNAVMGYGYNVCSAHPSWLFDAFVHSVNVQKNQFDQKNKRFAFSQLDIRILCENAHAQTAAKTKTAPILLHGNEGTRSSSHLGAQWKYYQEEAGHDKDRGVVICHNN